MWSELLKREIFRDGGWEKEINISVVKVSPHTPLGLLLNWWLFAAAKTSELLMGEGDHFSRSVRACHGCALHVPVLSVPGDSPCHPQAAENHWPQAKSKKRWKGSVLHTVTSSFHSLKSEAGVKPLGSHMVLWETWDPNAVLHRQPLNKSWRLLCLMHFAFSWLGWTSSVQAS